MSVLQAKDMNVSSKNTSDGLSDDKENISTVTTKSQLKGIGSKVLEKKGKEEKKEEQKMNLLMEKLQIQSKSSPLADTEDELGIATPLFKDMKVQLLPKDIDKDEPILIEEKNRFVLFPIANKEVCFVYLHFFFCFL